MKKIAIAILLPFFLVVFVDQLSKHTLAGGGSSILNYGVISGFLESAPEVYRRVFVSTVYGLLCFIFVFTQSILLRRSTSLSTALSIFFGGVSGNAIDRIFHGAVTDFIQVGNIVFNFADIAQWIGLIMALTILTIERDSIFHPNDARAKFLIDSKFQLKIAGKFCFASVATSFITGIFSYTFILSTHSASDMNLNFFAIAYAVITLLFSFIVFLSALFITQKTAGPVYAFDRFIQELMKGEATPLHLRATDDFHYRQINVTTRILLSFHFLKTIF